MASANLCEPCSNFDIKAALLWKTPGQTLQIGPFDHPINETTCKLCQIARHVVSYQDRHDNHVIRIKPESVGTLIVERMQDGLYRGAGFINASPDGEKYWKIVEDVDVALNRVESSFGLGLSAQPPAAWYRTYDEKLAVDQTLEWLQTCTSKHRCVIRRNCQKLPASSSFFIDVTENRIVRGDACVFGDYFALSYVCGGHKTLELTTENQDELAKPSSLPLAKLPKTYTDAIRFTQLCGVRYLWIDFLCILHDDQLAKQSQIDTMDEIYGKAALVLVAGLGASAEFGLYPKSIEAEKVNGIWPHLQRQTLDNDDQIHLMDVMMNKYWTRSWCFQEQFLSTRKLYFGAHWLRFHCNEMNFMIHPDAAGSFEEQDVAKIKHVVLQEETWSMQTISLAGKSKGSVTFSDLFWAYSIIVEGFTERELSYPEDVERAFAGIASVLSRIGENVLYSGIPSILLPHALLWTPRTTTEMMKRSQTVKFNSYAWTSCANGVTYFPLEGEFLIRDSRVKTLTTPLVSVFKRDFRDRPLRGAVLTFETDVILAKNFEFDEAQIEQWSDVSVSEDNDNAGGIPFYCSGDESKKYAGYIKGITGGHENCLRRDIAGVGRYLVVPLVRAENVGEIPDDLGEEYSSNEYLGLIILEEDGLSIRIGVIRMQTWAFDRFPSFRECIRLH